LLPWEATIHGALKWLICVPVCALWAQHDDATGQAVVPDEFAVSAIDGPAMAVPGNPFGGGGRYFTSVGESALLTCSVAQRCPQDLMAWRW